jgi:uncharacterized protein (DUF486 family)
MLRTAALLTVSNLFMTFAWYAHLRDLRDRPLWVAILVSWGIAFFEYCVQVPANRGGYATMSLGQLKVMQEIVTMVVFAVFSVAYMRQGLSWNYLGASACMVGAAWFMFR